MSGLKLPHDAWVVVMDGKKALILRNEGDEKFIHLQVIRETEQENPPTSEQGTGRPGRLNDPTSHRSAVEETDLHQLAEDRFTIDMARQLYADAHKGEFQHLVVTAPPKALGVLRKELHKIVQERIIAEIDKDLTGHPVSEIERILTGA
jgi:protein required for attachment to host cells